MEESDDDAANLDRAHDAVARHSVGAPHVDREQRRVSAPVDDRVAAMAGVLRDLQEDRVAIADIGLRKPTLDDVFLRLTGHGTDNDVPQTDGKGTR
ncbi:MAG: hypothetical protein ABJA74_10465 [Lapillicoccus sp.]